MCHQRVHANVSYLRKAKNHRHKTAKLKMQRWPPGRLPEAHVPSTGTYFIFVLIKQRHFHCCTTPHDEGEVPSFCVSISLRHRQQQQQPQTSKNESTRYTLTTTQFRLDTIIPVRKRNHRVGLFLVGLLLVTGQECVATLCRLFGRVYTTDNSPSSRFHNIRRSFSKDIITKSKHRSPSPSHSLRVCHLFWRC